MAAASGAGSVEGARLDAVVVEAPREEGGDLDARIEGLRDRLPRAADSDTNILVNICTWIEKAISAVMAAIKGLWNMVFGTAAEEAESGRAESPVVRAEGRIPSSVFGLYRASVVEGELDERAIGEWKGHMMQGIGMDGTDHFDEQISALFAMGLNDQHVVEVLEDIKGQMSDTLRGPTKNAFDVALNKNRWLHFLRWMHQEGNETPWSALIHNVKRDGSCMMRASVWGLEPVAQPGERYTAGALRRRMFHETFDAQMKGQKFQARAFRAAWIQALSTFELGGEEVIDPRLLPREGWELDLFVRYGTDLVTNEGYRIGSLSQYCDTTDTNIPGIELRSFLGRLNDLIAKYRALQLHPLRWNGEPELPLLALALGRAVVVERRDGDWDAEHLAVLLEEEGDPTIELTEASQMRLEPLAIYGAEYLPIFGALVGDEEPREESVDPLFLFNLNDFYYMGVRYVESQK